MNFRCRTNGISTPTPCWPARRPARSSLTGVTNGNAGTYTVVVSDNAGSVTSSPAMLTVSSAATVPNITRAAAKPHAHQRQFRQLHRRRHQQCGGPTYQWYFNTNTLLSGQTGSTLTLSGVTNGNAGAYTVVVGNSVGSVTSSPAVLTVLSLPNHHRPTAKASRAPTAIPPASPSRHQQWRAGRRINGILTPTPCSAARPAATLTLSGVTNGNAGAYTVVVGNSSAA